jgi:hypothetical protein
MSAITISRKYGSEGESIAVRVARVMAKSQMTAEQAEAAVTESDRVRAAFVEEFYKAQWGPPGDLTW